jgi:WD40 repeat protein
VSASGDKSIRLWDWHSGEVIASLMGHESAVYSIAVMSDGSIASGSSDSTVRVWNGEQLMTGAGESTVFCGHTDVVYVVACMDDNDDSIASGSQDNSVRIWSRRLHSIVRTFEGHTRGVCALAYLFNGKIISGSVDHTIQIWDPNNKSPEVIIPHAHDDVVRALACTRDGLIVSGGWDNTVRLWDYRNGQSIEVISAFDSGVYAVAICDSCIVSGHNDGVVRVWTPQTDSAGCHHSLSYFMAKWLVVFNVPLHSVDV